MRNDLDTRARRASANLKEAVSTAELRSVPPGTASRRLPIAALRPIWIVALLLIGSAVGVAMVLESSPTPTTLAPVTTLALVPTTASEVVPSTIAQESTPTTAAAVPVAPVSTTVVLDTEPPLLTITSPEDGAEKKEKTITFAGLTEPGARVFAGRYEADVDSSGNWHIVLVLSEGANVARFVAHDQAGNESKAEVTVFYVIETVKTEPTTPTTEKKIAEFSANATFGSCSETPPYDVYFGTGEPGTLVEISSEYGSGSVEVGAEGQWEKKVHFETAPPGEPFVVHISDEFGRQKQLEFIYTP
ncbi:MAG: hypothetical protein WBM90_01920 [Acidimicrobiia bacterium]